MKIDWYDTHMSEASWAAASSRQDKPAHTYTKLFPNECNIHVERVTSEPPQGMLMTILQISSDMHQAKHHTRVQGVTRPGFWCAGILRSLCLRLTQVQRTEP